MLMQSMVAASTAADRPCHGALPDAPGEHFAPLRLELLAVVQTADRMIRGKDHRGGEHRPEQRASADLVHAGDARKPRARNSRSMVPSQRILPPAGSGRMRNRGTYSRSLETRGLAFEVAKVIQFRAPDIAGADHVDMVDHTRVHRENTFHALAEADLAHGDAFAHARIVARDDGAFKSLQPLLIAFLDLHVNPDRIAGPERRDVRPLVLIDKLGQQRIIHGKILNPLFYTQVRSVAFIRSLPVRAHSRSGRSLAVFSWAASRQSPDFLVVAVHQDVRHFPAPEFRRPRILRTIQKPSPWPAAWNDSKTAEDSFPSTPGSSRATTSITTAAASSPPLNT